MALLESVLSLRQLRYFACVVEQRGFTSAGAVLHVAQPALSRQIALLEEAFGEQLLVRLPNGVQPTEAGRRLYGLARDVLERVNGAQAELRGLDLEPQGRVAVALPASSGVKLITDIIKTCKAELPLVDLQVLDGISTHSGHVLESGLVDFAVVPNADEVAGITAEDLFREHLFLVRTHPQASREPPEIALTAIGQMPLVLGPRSTHLRRVVEKAAVAQGMALNLRYEQRTLTTIAGFVRAGLAATISNWPGIVENTLSGTMLVQRIVQPELSRTISMAYTTARPLNHAAKATYLLVKRLVHAHVADGSWRGEVP